MMRAKQIWEDESVSVDVRLRLAVEHIRLLEGKVASYEALIKSSANQQKTLLNEQKFPRATWTCPQ